MDKNASSPLPRPDSPRQYIQRQRSNSFPIVEALGCSTPEAQLILAEGRAAVRRRRERSRRNRSVNDNSVVTFDPRDHLQYLNTLAALPTPSERPYTSEGRGHHSRIPSDLTDESTSTIVGQAYDSTTPTNTLSTSPLGDYSANLAQFIKAQLKSIPTYNGRDEMTSPLSPHSCPELSFPGSPPLSPKSPNRSARRPMEAPKIITIPTVRPPMRSAFSAWSSTDDDTDDEAFAMPDIGFNNKAALSKGSNYTPSVLGYYEQSNTSFLFSSTPLEEESDPETAKASKFPGQSTLPGAPEVQADNDYPSSSFSQANTVSSSMPSNTSSASTSSYFDCKRSTAITAHMKDRVIAAVTPSRSQSKMLTATSPWEGGALANVHDVFVESQQRVHVDGMSFDMVRDFIVPSELTTPV